MQVTAIESGRRYTFVYQGKKDWRPYQRHVRGPLQPDANEGFITVWDLHRNRFGQFEISKIHDLTEVIDESARS